MAVVKKGEFDFGWFTFIKDFIIIICFIPLADIESVIYSLILMTLTTPIIDYMVTAPKKASIKKTMSRKKGRWISLLIVGLVLVILFSGVAIYLGKVFKANTEAIYAYNTKYIENVETKELEEGVTAYVPEGEIKAGLVFYPGARIEYTAYEPLLNACAEEGIVCIVIEMPQNLAFFGINEGVDATKHFPEVEIWYIGGHSLGGTMAAFCASDNEDLFSGVILLASYSTKDISNLEVLSVYGTNDKILNTQNYNNNKDNLPNNLVEHVIDGGNHAYFGMYGKQDGDGKATISNAEQINEAAQEIVNFILK